MVTANFDAVKEILDDLSEIEMTVTNEEATHIPAINSEGIYNINGEQILAFSRIRRID